MKVVNFVIGLGTAIILVALITLGIQAFYPMPQPPTFPNTPVAPIQQCANSDMQCIAQENAAAAAQAAANNQFNQEQQTYSNQIQIYNRNIFIIANIVGVIVFAIGFWLLFATSIAAQSVPIGIMIAGLCSIIYGYSRGWGSVNDQLKFFIGLVIAALVIGGSIWLVQRYAKKRGSVQ
jgi:hypothetical protein